MTPTTCHDCRYAQALTSGWPLRGTASCRIPADVALAMLPGAFRVCGAALRSAPILSSEPHLNCPAWAPVVGDTAVYETDNDGAAREGEE